MSVFKDFPGIENLEKNSKTFKDFQGPARALIIRKPCHIVFNGYDIKPVSYTHLTLPTNREV